jgi:hypothetical protein
LGTRLSLSWRFTERGTEAGPLAENIVVLLEPRTERAYESSNDAPGSVGAGVQPHLSVKRCLFSASHP